MGNSILSLLFILGLSSFNNAYDGVKGGYRRPPEPDSNLAVFPAAENGTCYKRMPYDQAVAANRSGNVQLVPGSPQSVKQDTVYVTVIDCCDGFSRNPSSGKCETHCEEGCQGGTCTGPNVCTCEQGWSAERGICKPICRSPCPRDSYCFSPDVCRCKLGYEEDAYGQCKPVCPGDCSNGDCIAPRMCRCRHGYTLNERQECKPVCEGGCTNGDCTSPGVCACYPGYVNPPGDRETCVDPNAPDRNRPDAGGHYGQSSQCRDGCRNGRCVGSDQCECNPGYRMDPRTRTCTPSRGQDPRDPYHPDSANQYGDHSNQCRDGCRNGQCLGPNQCVCNPGFQLDPRTQTCIQTHDGSDPYPTERPDTRYQCPRGCINGRCVGPDQCACNPGFRMDPRTEMCITAYKIDSETESPDTHQPQQPRDPYQQPQDPNQCRLGCPNGRCVGPNQCICNEGFVMDPRSQMCVDYWSSQGQPNTTHEQSSQCRNGCRYGQCVGPDQCVCNTGYRMDPRTQTCVPSYGGQTEQPSDPNRPHCPEGCRNGQCVGPNQCVCNPGYQMDPRTRTCVRQYHHGAVDPLQPNSGSQHGHSSQCRDGCPNGRCVGPDQCECNPGYRMDPRTRSCAPSREHDPRDPYRPHDPSSQPGGHSSQCRDGCPNGRCVGPDQCACNPGFRMDPRTRMCTQYQTEGHDPHSQSQCRDGCRYGQCVGPDQCVCNPGYRMDPRTQTCRPHYGAGSDPHSRPDSGPQCRDGCRNGQCVGPDQCVCNPGFRMDPRTRSCVQSPESDPRDPYHPNPQQGHSNQCRNGCQNGQCVGPDQCVCNPGYQMDPRTQSCVRQYYHGAIDPSTVQPPDSGNQYGQSSQCRDGCRNGRCVGPDQCICNPGYRMDPRTRTCAPSDPRPSHGQDPQNPHGQPSHQCRNGCPNGQCVGPNQCVCNHGYIMNPRTEMCVSSSADESWGIEHVSPSESDHTSSPNQCRDGCPNGQCIGPNQCVCNPGYRVNNQNRCVPTVGADESSWSPNPSRPQCDRPCLNGECTGYNQCSCNPGHTNDPSDPNKCVPVCHGGCPNGVCTAPNRCICNPGYTKDRSVKGSQRCVPV